MDFGLAIAGIDALAREAALFAGVGFLVGGLDDLAADAIYLTRRREPCPAPCVAPSLRYAVLLPAWDEAAVIGDMLRATLAAWGGRDFRLYVAAYPNDVATIAAVGNVAARDPRVRLAIGERTGPTTKGCNLNVAWRALCRDEAAEDWHADAVVLHDAEDLVDRAELATYDRYLVGHDYVQLPVLPLIASDSRWVSAHYADEFAEVHHRNLIIRERLGAGLPLAGTGCAIRRSALDRIASARGAAPFDPDSLTEDYELGLALSASGARGCFARHLAADGMPVAVRAYFPATLSDAIRQKARWMQGIALLGWDRIGWNPKRGLAEVWMRMRDRRAPLAMLVLATAYLALAAGALAAGLHFAVEIAPPTVPDWVGPLFAANTVLLLWRLAMRGLATGRAYGWREGVRALPRMVVGNFIGILAARRAITRYVATLAGAPPRWDKTAHVFPATAPVVR